MAIEDLTPFGTAPKFYEGLLGADETAALQKRAQIQGLLGAGLVLAQGMSRGGAPRSALQNILGSVAGGFQAAGGAYEGALKNLQNEQQIKQMQLKQQQAQNQITGIANAKSMYPDLAPLADIDPQEFVKAVAAREETNRARERMSAYEQIGAPTQQPVSNVPTAPSIPLYGDIGEAPQNAIDNQQAQPQLSQLEQNKQQAAIFRQRQQQALLNKDTEAAKFFGDRAEELYPKAGFYRVGDELISTIDMKPVYTAKAKPEKFTGNYANLALSLGFGTADPAEMTPQQRQLLQAEATKRGIGEGQKINVYTGNLDKTNTTKVQEQQLNTSDQIARLNNIQFSYRPEFLNPKFRATQEWNTLKDKFGTLPESEKAQLGQFSQYKQNAVQNLNLTIKELTGASMGVQEADRIISTLPNPGMGVFDGDSPTQFKAKLDNAVQQTKYSLARKQYALKNGLKWENIDLGQMPTIVNKRAADIAKQYKLDPNKEADRNTIKTQLAAEFGIAF
jgi:hypothetical protein